ncbi:MAG: thiopurine S-methyltransferase [Phormidesmis sp.]
MQPSFWHQLWESNRLGFHKSKPHPLLVRYFGELSLPKGSRIFLPLCGKTLDIGWLLSQGYRVAGAELSKIAIEQLFSELGIEPTISNLGAVSLYSSKEKGLDIFVGNIFDVSREILGTVDAIYDRAALVALPPEVRNRYTAHLMELTNQAPQLLITFEYDQSKMEGPPFSISETEITQHYNNSYESSLLISKNVAGGLKSAGAAKENVWLLQQRK